MVHVHVRIYGEMVFSTNVSVLHTEMLCNHFNPHTLHIVNSDHDFEGDPSGSPIKNNVIIISDFLTRDSLTIF